MDLFDVGLCETERNLQDRFINPAVVDLYAAAKKVTLADQKGDLQESLLELADAVDALEVEYGPHLTSNEE